MPANVRVNVGEGYNVKIRCGLISRLGIEILRLNEESDINNEIVIITDEKVSGLYLQKIITNFQECPRPEGVKFRICEILINSDEGAKNFGTISNLLENMAALGMSKNCCVIAIGGEVVCNSSAFAAMCYMGGVKLVLVPTTLAAMIQASAGGNAFLNLSVGKNLARMSCNPALVLCDTDCIKTLPEDEYKSGLSEALKTAILSGEDMFKIFERLEASENICKIIEGCIKFRASVISDDMQKIFMLGSPVCEAIESLSMYNIQHGLALSQSIAITARAGVKMGWCNENIADRILDVMRKYELPVNCSEFKAGVIARKILDDMKISSGMLQMAAPCEIGRCEIHDVRHEDLEGVIALGMGI